MITNCSDLPIYQEPDLLNRTNQHVRLQSYTITNGSGNCYSYLTIANRCKPCCKVYSPPIHFLKGNPTNAYAIRSKGIFCLYFLFSHLADAFNQSDLQMRTL